MNDRKKSIVIFEVEGGNDKGPDGYRKDTRPIQKSIEDQGWNCEILFYRDDWNADKRAYIINNFSGYISRVNPGNIPGGEQNYFSLLRDLSDNGLVGMSHPDLMVSLGAKDILYKLRDTSLVPTDTYAYYSQDEFVKQFPTSLALGDRILKQNRGSTGEGIWRVQSLDNNNAPGQPLNLSTKIKCTEAKDNHVKEYYLGDFMDFCSQYTDGSDGMLVDMQYLPRIVEGELRLLLVGDKPFSVVHKKPADVKDAFSATLFSGAKYEYESPEVYGDLIKQFNESLPQIKNTIGNFSSPLIWGTDFILDTNTDGSDKYVLGEINCSCVGFTNELEKGIQEAIAKEAIAQIENKVLLVQ